MRRSSWRCWVFVAVLLASTAMAASTAEAWGRGHYRGAYGYGYSYGYGGYGCCGSYYSSCCTYRSCYTPCCYTGSWYGCGYRRACGTTSCCRYSYCGRSCCYASSDCCGAGSSTVGAVEPKAEPTLAPKRPNQLAPPPEPPTMPAPTGRAEPDQTMSPNVSVPAAVVPRPTEAPTVPAPTSVPDIQAEPASPAPAAAPAGPADSRVSVPEGSAVLSVSVPARARVIVNGLETKSTGPHRQFVSTGLRPGLTYKYEVRVRVVRNGRLLEDTRTIHLKSGLQKAIAFSPVAKPGTAVAAL